MLFKYLWLCLFSQKGEGEGEDNLDGQSADSDDSQGGQDASTDDDSQDDGQGQAGETQDDGTLAEMTQKLNDLQVQYETLKGQSSATERNLSAERKALETMGLKLVKDHDGNVSAVPIAKKGGQSRFTDEHKTKFSSYFPDADSAKNYLDLMNAWAEDFFADKIKNYDQTLTQRQQFQTVQTQSNNRMMDLYPALDANSKEGFNQSFYDKATEIWEANYKHLANGELIAANEAAIEMGISPAKVAEAKKAGYQQGKTSRKIVSSGQGSQSQGSSVGFKKLPFEEYSKLNPDKKKKYDTEEVAARKG